MSETPVNTGDERPMRQFVGFIWIGENPGIRLTVDARTVDEAIAAVIAEYREGHRISLSNEDDARRPRNTAQSGSAPDTAETQD
jgi:hypothetical protein